VAPQPDQASLAAKDSAVQTLQSEMVFYRDHAALLIEKIIESLKSQGANGLAIAMMYKHAADAKKMCVDTAAKLAPYQSPRLQSIEVTKQTTHKYVIEAPKRIDSEQDWIANTRRELKLIDNIKRSVEDAEVVSTHPVAPQGAEIRE